MDAWFEFVITITGYLITVAVYLIIAALGALVLTGLWFSTDSLRRPWQPMQRIRRTPWFGLDVFVVFVIAQLIPPLVDESLRQAGFFEWLYGEASTKATREREALWSLALAWPLVIALSVLGLRQFRKARLIEMGLTVKRAAKNLAIGYCVWAILAPLALLVFELSVCATPTERVEKHPVIEAGQNSIAASDWIILLIVTIGLAPLVEEIIFRGILLPWQLRRGWEAQATVAVCALLFATMAGVSIDDKPYNPLPVVFVLAMLPIVFLVPFLPFRRPMLADAAPSETENASARIGSRIAVLFKATAVVRNQPNLAIFTNGLFFASLHSRVWPSPIALFILGMGLAWVAYRTSSLVGAVTLHVLFNAIAALSLVAEHLWRQ